MSQAGSAHSKHDGAHYYYSQKSRLERFWSLTIQRLKWQHWGKNKIKKSHHILIYSVSLYRYKWNKRVFRYRSCKWQPGGCVTLSWMRMTRTKMMMDLGSQVLKDCSGNDRSLPRTVWISSAISVMGRVKQLSLEISQTQMRMTKMVW